MKHLMLLCSHVAVEAIADYITSTFQQDAGMPELSVLWQGKTARHDIGIVVIEGEAIPERLLDMLYTSRDLFDFTEVFEGGPVSAASTEDSSTTGKQDVASSPCDS